MERWVGKVAVVTGASAGIGAAIAVDLVKAGMIVVGLARRKERVEQLRDQLPREAKDKLHAFHCDVSDDASIVQAFKGIGAKFGAIHVLVNNAGIIKSGGIFDAGNEEALRSVLNTNLWGLVLCTKKAVEIMKREKVTGAHIININSLVGHNVFYANPKEKPVLNVYPSSKFGVTALTEVLRQEFNHDNFQFKVTSVSPGAVRTEIAGLENVSIFDHIAHLHAADVSQGVLYALGTPPHVNVSEITIRPVGDLF